MRSLLSLCAALTVVLLVVACATEDSGDTNDTAQYQDTEEGQYEDLGVAPGELLQNSSLLPYPDDPVEGGNEVLEPDSRPTAVQSGQKGEDPAELPHTPDDGEPDSNSAYSIIESDNVIDPEDDGQLLGYSISKKPTQTGEQVKVAVQNGAMDGGPAGWDDHYGYGRVNLKGALDRVS